MRPQQHRPDPLAESIAGALEEVALHGEWSVGISWRDCSWPTKNIGLCTQYERSRVTLITHRMTESFLSQGINVVLSITKWQQSSHAKNDRNSKSHCTQHDRSSCPITDSMCLHVCYLISWHVCVILSYKLLLTFYFNLNSLKTIQSYNASPSMVQNSTLLFY